MGMNEVKNEILNNETLTSSRKRTQRKKRKIFSRPRVLLWERANSLSLAASLLTKRKGEVRANDDAKKDVMGE